MLDKIGESHIHDICNNSSPHEHKLPAVNSGEDASLRVDYEVLISKAQKAEKNESITVEDAKKLVKSGRLDTDENIREAAENIILFGI